MPSRAYRDENFDWWVYEEDGRRPATRDEILDAPRLSVPRKHYKRPSRDSYRRNR